LAIDSKGLPDKIELVQVSVVYETKFNNEVKRNCGWSGKKNFVPVLLCGTMHSINSKFWIFVIFWLLY
jgi:hypothetical protein